ncbi:MAG: T9SS type A sorting domain-containing protein [Rubricoccaceae bacterium]|nr:T9SS type A sorting domain-containing protein [Rubricoccaceae bacterium]
MRTLHTVALLVLLLLTGAFPASAQITLLSSFNPPEIGGLCGLGFDPVGDVLWVYDCSDDEVVSYSTDGTFLGTAPRPGESANDVDVEIAPELLTLNATTIPAGTVLFINGESGPAEIYAIDPDTGTVLDTLATGFGVSHVVGGAYSSLRDTFFLVQDNVPGAEDENRIAEIDPVTGAVLNTFQIGATFNVSFGDLEVSTVTGNLFVVSSIEARIAEYEPDGTFVAYHDLPGGVSSLSGIGLDCAQEEAWVSNTSGVIYQLGDVPCGASCPLSLNSATITPLTVSPGGTFAVMVDVANAGPGSRTARLDLDYAQVGGGLSGTLTLGRGTVPVTSGVSATLNQRVPGNTPGGTYALDVNLVDDATGTVCDTRPFALTVQTLRSSGTGHALVAPAPDVTDLFAASSVAASLIDVFPNPLDARATFRFTLDAPADVRLVVYDVLGRVVAVPVSERRPAGAHAAEFDASRLPPGLYLYRLVTGTNTSTGRVTIAR